MPKRAAEARAIIGAQGEAFVANHLTSLGYTVVARNARVGRLELDIVALRGNVLVFCEVRTRTGSRLMQPVDTIDQSKVERVRRAAAAWLHAHPQGEREVRFDAASVVLGEGEPQLTYYEQAF